MPIKVRYQLRKESVAPIVASIFSLISAILLIVIYWPVFVQYLSGGTYEGAPLTGLTVIFYSILILFLLLFALFTATSAKKTLVPSSICALFVFLFYFLDVSGLRNTILFFDADNVFHYYRETKALFNGWWFFVAVVAIFIAVTSRCYLRIAFHKARTKNVGVIISCVTSVLWVIYSLIRFIDVDLHTFRQGIDFTSRDLLYAIMYYLAGALFFVSVTMLFVAVRKTLVGETDALDKMVQPTAPGYAEAGTLPYADPVQPEQSYTVVPDPVQYVPPVTPMAPEPVIPETYHPDPDEALVVDPHEESAVVSVEQAEALLHETPEAEAKAAKKASKSRRSKKADKQESPPVDDIPAEES